MQTLSILLVPGCAFREVYVDTWVCLLEVPQRYPSAQYCSPVVPLPLMPMTQISTGVSVKSCVFPREKG